MFRSVGRRRHREHGCSLFFFYPGPDWCSMCCSDASLFRLVASRCKNEHPDLFDTLRRKSALV
jgi:hypothetical protein